MPAHMTVQCSWMARRRKAWGMLLHSLGLCLYCLLVWFVQDSCKYDRLVATCWSHYKNACTHDVQGGFQQTAIIIAVHLCHRSWVRCFQTMGVLHTKSISWMPCFSNITKNRPYRRWWLLKCISNTVFASTKRQLSYITMNIKWRGALCQV